MNARRQFIRCVSLSGAVLWGGEVLAQAPMVDEKDPTEIVDVWLGIEQSYLPVKLRFPVARNRLMVDQVATRVVAD